MVAWHGIFGSFFFRERQDTPVRLIVLNLPQIGYTCIYNGLSVTRTCWPSLLCVICVVGNSCRTKNVWPNPYVWAAFSTVAAVLCLHWFCILFFFRHIGSHTPQEVVQRQLVCSDQSLIRCFIIRPLTECVHWSSTWMSDWALTHEPRQPKYEEPEYEPATSWLWWRWKLYSLCMLQSPWTYYRCNWVVSGAVLAASVLFFYVNRIILRPQWICSPSPSLKCW